MQPLTDDRRARRDGVIETVCVLVVLVAVVALVAWFVVHAGGGVINQG